ncbi:MAG: histidine kinase dimerization/phospho-acceptor domain-containing protein, partial [Ktedonobacteraceae bacterium]
MENVGERHGGRFSKALEREFREAYARSSVPFVSFGLLLAATLYILFYFWDITLDPRDAPQALAIRVPIALIFAGFGVAMRYSEFLLRRMQAVISILLIIAGCGIVVILVLLRQGMTLGIGGILLVLMYVYGFGRLLFFPSLVCGLLIVVAWNCAAVLTRSPVAYIISNNFFLVSATLIGAWTTFLLEKLFRAQFITNKEVEAERYRANHFVAAISHDLRQPLTTLALRLKLLRERIGGGELATDIQVLEQQTGAIETMVGGTLVQRFRGANRIRQRGRA